MSLELEPAREPAQRQAERRDRIRAAVAVVVAAAVLAAIAFGGYAAARSLLPRPSGDLADYSGDGSGRVVVEVQPGDTSADIARTLEHVGVVKTARAFTREALVRADEIEKIQPGRYELREHMSAAAALDLLLDPASRLVNRVTLPEGLRLDETLAILAQKTGRPLAEYQRAVRNPRALGLPRYANGRVEGFLFPATYDIEPGTSAVEVLRMTTRRFAQAAADVGLTGRALAPYQLVVVASLVEGEASRPEDFGKVARVVYNRLAMRMKLQFDSTVNYALKADKVVVTDRDLLVDSPYNTYRFAGLPPGPIGSPGEAALRAAVNPPPGDWLYFVTTNPDTGETEFTASYEEFLRLKAKLKANRGG